ncbi:MAG TPA: hypothetical protein VH833_09080 [Gemmatimonadales bacterium]
MRCVTLMALGVLCAACGGGGDQGSGRRAGSDTLTQRQRDSMLSKSSIPGASGVGRAMTAADSTSARVQAADTVGQ